MIALLLASLALANDEITPLRTGSHTPFVIGSGHAAAGVFRPITLGVGERTDLRAKNGILTLFSPHIQVKQQLTEGDGIGFAVRGGLGIPMGGLFLLNGAGFTSSDPTVKTGVAFTADAALLTGYRSDVFDIGLSVEGRFGVRGSSWTLQDPGMFLLDPALAPLIHGPQLRPRLIVEVFPQFGERPLLGFTADWMTQIGSGGPDSSLRMLASYAISRRVVLAAGEVIATETRPDGNKTFASPIADLQLRW